MGTESDNEVTQNVVLLSLDNWGEYICTSLFSTWTWRCCRSMCSPICGIHFKLHRREFRLDTRPRSSISLLTRGEHVYDTHTQHCHGPSTGSWGFPLTLPLPITCHTIPFLRSWSHCPITSHSPTAMRWHWLGHPITCPTGALVPPYFVAWNQWSQPFAAGCTIITHSPLAMLCSSLLLCCLSWLGQGLDVAGQVQCWASALPTSYRLILSERNPRSSCASSFSW